MMKLLLIPFVSIVFLCLFSCKKESDNSTRYDRMLSKNSGTIAVKVNGTNWPFSPRVIVFTSTGDPSGNTFDLSAEIFDDNKESYETLMIGGISRSVKTDTLITALKYHTSQNMPAVQYSHPHSEFLLGGEDYTETMYDLLRDSSNGITVDTYDSATQKVKGNFHFTMVRTWGKPSQGLPDTLHFTDGVFDLKINPNP